MDCGLVRISRYAVDRYEMKERSTEPSAYVSRETERDWAKRTAEAQIRMSFRSTSLSQDTRTAKVDFECFAVKLQDVNHKCDSPVLDDNLRPDTRSNVSIEGRETGPTPYWSTCFTSFTLKMKSTS